MQIAGQHAVVCPASTVTVRRSGLGSRRPGDHRFCRWARPMDGLRRDRRTPRRRWRRPAGEIYDHRLIRRHRDGAGFAPADALAEHQLSRSRLAAKLATPHAGLDARRHASRAASRGLPPGPWPQRAGPRLLLGLHRVDRGSSVRRHGGIDLRPSSLEPGHRGHGLPLLSAQPGYPGEDSGWTGPGGFDI